MNTLTRLLIAPVLAIALFATPSPAAGHGGSMVTQIVSVQWMRAAHQSVGMTNGTLLYAGGYDCNGQTEPLSWEEYKELRHIAQEGLTIQLFWIESNVSSNKCLTGWRVMF